MVLDLTTFAAAGLGGIGWLAVRESRRVRAARRGLLDGCRELLGDEVCSIGGDGFPRISGHHRTWPARIDLVPDTFVVRRLPQLWLRTTVAIERPGLAAVSVLQRPTGMEFYAVTHRLADRLDTPSEFPPDVIVRGSGAARRMLDEIAPALADCLADPKVKEITITERGLRVLRQASEGRRGDHLLLRQAVFDSAPNLRADVEWSLAAIDRLSALAANSVVRCAA